MITLTREEAQQVLDALESDNPDIQLRTAITLRARLAQPEPEPVMLMDAPLLLNGQPLYPAPPQRKEWQGLTYEEIEQIVDQHWEDLLMFAEAIEAKLREKNT